MRIQPLLFALGSPTPAVASGAHGLTAAEEAAIAAAQWAKAAAAVTGTGGLSLFAAAKRRAKGGQRAALRAYSTSMLRQSEATSAEAAGAVPGLPVLSEGAAGATAATHDAPHGEEGDSEAADGDIDASQWGGFVPGGPAAEPTAPREGVSASAGRDGATSPAHAGSARKVSGTLAPPPSDINAVLMQERQRQTAAAVAAAQVAAAPSRWGPFHSIIAIRPTGWAQQTGGPGGSGGGGGGGKRGSEAGDASEVLNILASIAGGDARRVAVGGASAAAPSSFNRRDGAEDLRPGAIAPAPISASTSSAAGSADGGAFSDAGLLRDMEAQQRESNSRHDVTELRQAPGECHVVLLGPDGESARAVSPRPGPPASTTALRGGAGPGGLHQLHSVRLTRQTRLGGARCHATPRTTPLRQPGQPLPPGGVTLLSAPYSEHSSFGELRQCVAWARPARVVPTANCRSREDAERLVALLTAGQSETLKQ